MYLVFMYDSCFYISGTVGSGGKKTTVVPVYTTMPEVRIKPVTHLPPPRTDKIYNIHVYEPNKGVGNSCMCVFVGVLGN